VDASIIYYRVNEHSEELQVARRLGIAQLDRPLVVLSCATPARPRPVRCNTSSRAGRRHWDDLEPPFARNSTTHAVQNAWPHGSRVGSRGGSKQTRHCSVSAARLHSRSCCAWAAAAAARTYAAQAFLCPPYFQCSWLACVSSDGGGRMRWAERTSHCTAHCTPTRVRTLAHLEACLAAVLGLAALAALHAGAQRAAVAARLAVSVTLAAALPLPPPFLAALPPFVLAVLLRPAVAAAPVAVVASSGC